jgi:hypothetical protein
MWNNCYYGQKMAIVPGSPKQKVQLFKLFWRLRRAAKLFRVSSGKPTTVQNDCTVQVVDCY